MKYRILIVDDESENLLPTKQLLESWGYLVEAAQSGEEAIALMKNAFTEYAVILLDYHMPRGMNGLDTAIEMKKLDPSCVILMYSCDDNRDVLRDTLTSGAINFVDKNENVDQLKTALDQACIRFEETRLLRPSKDGETNQAILKSIGMVGRSAKMAEAAKTAIKYSNTKATALIMGESGSGKERIAQAMHKDKNAPFFAVNCGAMSQNLLESELFGYEKGAFTGADKSKPGLLESARGGTVFLDEIHQMDRKGQVALLRAIREKKIRRVGSNQQEVEINCRIIAAAKTEVKNLMKTGEFLEDLYYRFMLQIEVPPLRDRKEDIELLVDHFCKKYEAENGIKKAFTARTVRYLEDYNWPGNVGELEGYVYQLLTLAPRDLVEPKLLDERFSTSREIAASSVGLTTYADLELRQEQERREFIIGALKKTTSKRHAAERLNVNESTLRSLIQQLEIKT